MLAEILAILGQGITACKVWFDSLTFFTGTWVLIYSFIIMFIVARFIINPFIGAATKVNAYDSVHRARSQSNSKSNSKSNSGGK